MNQCTHVRKQFSGYLDGAVTGAAMHEIALHLEGCSSCAAEFAEWRNAQSLLSSIGPAKAPPNLGLRLRVALSQESANTAQEKLSRGRIRWHNTFRPLVLQATAGLASTILRANFTAPDASQLLYWTSDPIATPASYVVTRAMCKSARSNHIFRAISHWIEPCDSAGVAPDRSGDSTRVST